MAEAFLAESPAGDFRQIERKRDFPFPLFCAILLKHLSDFADFVLEETTIMSGFINALPGAISQGLIWGIMAIGVYIT